TENFSNFVLGNHSEILLFYCFFHYKVTKNFADYQIFNELYFIELTLFINQKAKRRIIFLTRRFSRTKRRVVLLKWRFVVSDLQRFTNTIIAFSLPCLF
ncbi:MAG: hypothetical protein MR791_02795, partial [Bacteroidales bacterium]|nr:hypothetical protein [Bacteroidales bacterium]